MDLGKAKLALGLSDDVKGMQAIAVIWEPSITFNVGTTTIELSLYVGGVGAEFAYIDGKWDFGYSGPFGFGISFY